MGAGERLMPFAAALSAFALGAAGAQPTNCAALAHRALAGGEV